MIVQLLKKWADLDKNIAVPLGTSILMIPIAIVFIAGIIVFFWHAQSDLPAMGIETSPDKQAGYIAGEACTINTPLSTPSQSILANAEWCAMMHRKWQEKVAIESNRP